MTENRHPKWTQVPAITDGKPTRIPAGQPWRLEMPDGRAFEYPGSDCTVTHEGLMTGGVYFIDSSWKPPLVLPTEPTWGIAVTKWATFSSGHAAFADLFSGAYPEHLGGRDVSIPKENVIDFIPLTDEQVLRIESHR